MSLFPSCIVDIFSVAGAAVWTKRAGAKFIKIQGTGGGAGGQGGGCAAPGGSINAAFGGNGAPWCEMNYPANILGNTENVVVGAGGTAGAAQTVSGTQPSDGFSQDGQNSTLGAWFFAPFANHGAGGFNPHYGVHSDGTALKAPPPATINAFGDDGGTGGGALGTWSDSNLGGAAGGNGGSITTGAAGLVPNVGGRGGGASTLVPKTAGRTTPIGGGANSANNSGLPGGNGASPVIGNPFGAGGGGGAGCMVTAAGVAGAGGNGGQPGGGGGGGGASIFGVSTGGAGGTGGTGIVIVTTYF